MCSLDRILSESQASYFLKKNLKTLKLQNTFLMFSTLFSGKRKSTLEYSGPNRNAFTFSSRKKPFVILKEPKEVLIF